MGMGNTLAWNNTPFRSDFDDIAQFSVKVTRKTKGQDILCFRKMNRAT